MQIFDITLAPGASRQVDVQASYVYYLNGSAGGADATLELRPINGGDTVYLKPGQAYKMPPEMTQGVTRWIIKNMLGAGTILGQVMMGAGEFTDNRITGSVEVIDGGRNRTAANQAFIGSSFAGSVGGQYPLIQLWNPAASGKVVVLKSFSIGSSLAGTVDLRANTVALAGVGGSLINKRLGGASGGAQVLNTNAVAITAGSVVSSYMMGANGSIQFQLSEPIVMYPGNGVTADANVVAAAMVASFEWYEEPV